MLIAPEDTECGILVNRERQAARRPVIIDLLNSDVVRCYMLFRISCTSFKPSM